MLPNRSQLIVTVRYAINRLKKPEMYLGDGRLEIKNKKKDGRHSAGGHQKCTKITHLYHIAQLEIYIGHKNKKLRRFKALLGPAWVVDYLV